MASITENEIEDIALSYLQGLGYSYILGTDIAPNGEHPERQYTDVVLTTRLRDAIDKLNPSISQDAKEDALKKSCEPKAPMHSSTTKHSIDTLLRALMWRSELLMVFVAKRSILSILPIPKTMSFGNKSNYDYRRQPK